MALKCEAGYVYCGEPVERQCVICGRYFCAKHGKLDAPHCRHCARGYAEIQMEASAAALETARRELAAEQNRSGYCGGPACDEPPLVTCAHCGLEYCSRHSSRHHYSYRYRTRRGVETRQESVTLCDACRPQLKMYKREKTWLET